MLDLLEQQRESIKKRTEKKKGHLFPPKVIQTPIDHTHPSPSLQEKKIGCLVMAGGQATRLEANCPKGVIPFSPINHKSPLQIISEKILAFSICYNTTVPTAIMTSEVSHKEICDHFKANDFFGLENVSFFAQRSLPLLDMEMNPIFDKEGHLITGSDGNGSLFLACAPIIQQWEDEGIEIISIIQVDNPLIDPFHPAVLSPLFSGHDIVAAAVPRKDRSEQVGIFVQEEDRTTVIEYSELPQNALDGAFKWANISFFATTIAFAKKAASHKLTMHTARKRFQGREVWKNEYFIFDHLPFAENPAIVQIDRASFFAPIKNKTGPDSIETAQKAMIEKDRQRLQEISKTLEEGAVELPQEAYYPVAHSF